MNNLLSSVPRETAFAGEHESAGPEHAWIMADSPEFIEATRDYDEHINEYPSADIRNHLPLISHIEKLDPLKIEGASAITLGGPNAGTFNAAGDDLLSGANALA